MPNSPYIAAAAVRPCLVPGRDDHTIPSLTFQLHLLVRPGECPIGNESESGLLDPRTDAAGEDDLEERRHNHTFVDQLLHAIENRFALRSIHFDGLLLEEIVEIGVT